MVHFNVRANHGTVLLETLAHLRKGASGDKRNAITVHILAATDHDGVCAMAILSGLLDKVGVKYSLFPVTGNLDVSAHLETLVDNEEVRSVVMLNCGASLSIPNLIKDCNSELMCFIIDAHRPFHIDNLLKANDNVVLLDDDHPGNERKTPLDLLEEGALLESQEETGEFEDSLDQENSAQPNSLDSEEARAKKRRRRDEKIEAGERARDRLNQYYSESYYATPASLSLFKMARQADTNHPDFLWLAAVALTGSYDLGLLEKIVYDKLMTEELKDTLDRVGDMSQLNSQMTAESQKPEVPPPLSDDEDDAASVGAATGIPKPRRLPKRGKLRYETDLRLTLYKHWTAEESMMHSSYFYGTMELNREKGIRSLKHFFANAGIAPDEYSQIFSCMKLPTQKKLHDMYREKGPEYGLSEHMFIEQFVRDFGLDREARNALRLHEMSSLDAANLVTAILSSVPATLSSGRLESLPKTTDGARDTEAVHALERKELIQNFWRATEAVLCKDPDVLAKGLQEAVDQAKELQRMARRVIDTKAVSFSKSKDFRYVKIEQPPHIFRNQFAVRRLAIWLLHVLFTYKPAASRRGEGDKPLLVIVRDHVRETYLCVGQGSPRFETQNDFGYRFRGVVTMDDSLRYHYDSFDRAVIEIHYKDFDRFWDGLNKNVEKDF